jgi:toxin ParE1/3/4
MLLSEAENDILDIYRYVQLNDSEMAANSIFNNIEKTCYSLAEFPDRGHIPPELERIGIINYREIHYKFYRIIFEIVEKTVYIHCVLDGRRDMQQLLERRLIR